MLYEVFDCSVGLMCLILQEDFGVSPFGASAT